MKKATFWQTAGTGTPNIKSETLYLGGYEVVTKYNASGTATDQWEISHTTADFGRLGSIEQKVLGSNQSILHRFTLSDHLGSSCTELDISANIIGYTEYHPFGTVAYQATDSTLGALARRYQYCGKEKDEESGLHYYGARYYTSWLGRFISVDPKESKYFFQSSYAYAENSPVTKMDFNGEGSDEEKPKIEDKKTIYLVDIDGNDPEKSRPKNQKILTQNVEVAMESMLKALGSNVDIKLLSIEAFKKMNFDQNDAILVLGGDAAELTKFARENITKNQSEMYEGSADGKVGGFKSFESSGYNNPEISFDSHGSLPSFGLISTSRIQKGFDGPTEWWENKATPSLFSDKNISRVNVTSVIGVHSLGHQLGYMGGGKQGHDKSPDRVGGFMSDGNDLTELLGKSKPISILFRLEL